MTTATTTTTINKMFKLEWIASPLSEKIIALDLEIWIDRKTNSIKHESYTKDQNLFLCLFLNSAYSPNTLEGMVHSMIGKLWRPCIDSIGCTNETHLLHQRLMDVGHNPNNLTAIFNKASAKLSKKLKGNWTLTTTKKKESTPFNQRLFLYLEYHLETLLGAQCRNYTRKPAAQCYKTSSMLKL